ncbi:hypothetical protein KWM_0117830 [Xanthomonas vasicola pv. musacearum NCPPB 2005]|nr:hypothetical protein KWM_0117830 [Xanthomonas vasicola pv. musacearum NCPPB 2005]KFA07648.1 hypothetical protein KWQ_0115685 [Xanthomonas vasicola pv. musacearum NCPPB 4380]KFA18818.1 hypothetical protein A11G_0110070 [Xanthomonas vasicola pv. musacearum NCPPB 4392]KFA20339.1 hypothetical protein KWU_0115450 [Xanthomonas vasicola pv. musacearum NCPPB 4394]
MEGARADVANYSTQLAQSRNALNLVVGTSVPAALLPDSDAIETGVALAPLPALLESRVLLQRPDVLSAEHTLKAANADIGAARAALFPTISLTADVGRGSDALSNLFDGDHTWSFSPSVSLPIFRAGALKAELDVARLKRTSPLRSTNWRSRPPLVKWLMRSPNACNLKNGWMRSAP